MSWGLSPYHSNLPAFGFINRGVVLANFYLGVVRHALRIGAFINWFTLIKPQE